MVLTGVGMIVLVSHTDGAESVPGHRLYHILHDLLLVLHTERLGLPITAQDIVTPVIKTPGRSQITEHYHGTNRAVLLSSWFRKSWVSNVPQNTVICHQLYQILSSKWHLLISSIIRIIMLLWNSVKSLNFINWIRSTYVPTNNETLFRLE